MAQKIEDIILRHSKRGMNILREHIAQDFCEIAARNIYSLERKKILLTTGFYVAGFAETDGPPGTYFLARALKSIGFTPVILTDSFCNGFFDNDPSIEVVYLEKGFCCEDIIKQHDPSALISIERCGENINGDYANMRGVSIAQHTADIDRLFDHAKEIGLYTLGIGDGGNEIGMGNLKDVIEKDLSLIPCKTKVTDLIIATVSNWGAYALAGLLSIHHGKNLLANYEEVSEYLAFIVEKGSVDGVNKEHTTTVDGFSAQTKKEIIDSINEYVAKKIGSAY